MKKDMLQLLMIQLIADVKDEFMNEFREVIKEVIANEMQITGRGTDFLMNRLSYQEISNEYKVSENSLKKWKKQGLLVPICKGGRTLLFERGHVEECLRNRPRIKPKFGKSA